MKYMLSKPDGFLSKPEATSLKQAIANAEGCHLYVYNDQGQLILVKDLTDDLKLYIEDVIAQRKSYEDSWQKLRGEQLLSFAYDVEGRFNRKHYQFMSWILTLTENLIRDAKGIPQITKRVPYAE